MTRTPRLLLAALAVLFAVAALWGCSSTQGAAKATPASGPVAQFVLLSDADGHLGKVRVANALGEKTLDENREAVTVAGNAAPGETKILSEEELRKTFGPALDALPPPPAKFIFYFQPSTNLLTPESAAEIDLAAAAIRDRAFADVSIAGHADTVGSAEANDKLSMERAKAVAELLRAKGIDTSGFQIVSHGKNNPLVKTGDGVAEPKNRRVEIVVR